jgi:hypothetical protein
MKEFIDRRCIPCATMGPSKPGRSPSLRTESAARVYEVLFLYQLCQDGSVRKGEPDHARA